MRNNLYIDDSELQTEEIKRQGEIAKDNAGGSPEAVKKLKQFVQSNEDMQLRILAAKVLQAAVNGDNAAQLKAFFGSLTSSRNSHMAETGQSGFEACGEAIKAGKSGHPKKKKLNGGAALRNSFQRNDTRLPPQYAGRT